MNCHFKDEDVCPSSLAKYFHDLGAVVGERAHEISLKRTNKVIQHLGKQTRLTGTAKGFVCDIHATCNKELCSTDETFDELENWVGAALLGIDMDTAEGIFGAQGSQYS